MTVFRIVTLTPHAVKKSVFSDTTNATCNVYQTTLILGSYPFLIREGTSVAVGHVASIVWESIRISLKGGVVKYKIVIVVGKMQYCSKGL